MAAELREQRLADGDVLVNLGRPAPALLLGAGLDSSLRGLRDLLLGCVGVHLAVGGVSLRLIFLWGDEDLTLPLKFLFCCFSTATWTTPFSTRRLKIKEKLLKMKCYPIKKLKQETDKQEQHSCPFSKHLSLLSNIRRTNLMKKKPTFTKDIKLI